MNKEEEDALKREYGLSPDSSLVLRNMGRDIAGSIAGGMPGKFLANYGLALEHPNVVKAAVPLAWGGSILGSILASNKYSKGHAQEVMRERKKGE